jgi:hypothetical protein
MMKRVKVIPNQANSYVAVLTKRTVHHPFTGKKFTVQHRRFVVSAKLVSCEARAEVADAAPVTWKIVNGFLNQDDQGQPDLEHWTGEHVTIPSSEKDAMPFLEEALGAFDKCEWFSWQLDK